MVRSRWGSGEEMGDRSQKSTSPILPRHGLFSCFRALLSHARGWVGRLESQLESLSREVRLGKGGSHPNHLSPLGCPGQAPQESPGSNFFEA